MPVDPDLARANFSIPQSLLNSMPVTIAAAATIAPTNLLTFLTGTVQVATITPPSQGVHFLVLIFTNGSPGATLTTGNIQRAATPVQNVPLLFIFDPVSAKYWVGPLQ